MCRRRRARRRNRDVRPQRVQLLLTDSSDGEQILDAPKSAAFLPHVDDPLSRDLTHARQLLQFLHIRNVEVNGL